MAKRLRIAFFTPLLPVQSGLSDYSEELLPYLADLMDIDIVIDDCYQPATRPITERFACIGTSEFLSRKDSYDIAIYQIANNFDHHAYMLKCMEVCPGILVLHDFCLQYLVMNLLLRRGMVASLADVLRPEWGSKANRVARKLQIGQLDPNAFSFFHPLVAHSRAVIVHSQAGNAIVRRQFSDKQIAVIKMGVPLDVQVDATVRSRFGIAPDDFVVASVSTLAYTKRIDIVVRAFADFHAAEPRSKLLIVGGGALGASVRNLINSPQLKSAVMATGWVSKEDYSSLIGISDVVVDMRFPSGAETSASLSRAIALGRPLVVSRQGTFVELPDSFAIKIPVAIDGIFEEEASDNSSENEGDAREKEVIGEAGCLAGHLRRLHAQAELRKRMSDAALTFAREELSLARAAQRTTEFVQQVVEDKRTLVEPGSIFGGRTSNLNALIYKTCRTAYLLRNYGLRDTVKRVYQEVSKPRRKECRK